MSDDEHRPSDGDAPDGPPSSRYEGVEGAVVRETSPSGRELVAVLPWSRMAEAETRAARAIGRRVSIPGFRKGKAPPARIRQVHGEEVRKTATDELLQDVWKEVNAEKSLKPVGDPVVEDLVIEEGEPVRFTARFDVLPDLEIEGDLHFEVEDKVVRVSDEDVDEELEKLRGLKAEVVDSERDEAGPGDLALVDLTRLTEDGEPVDTRSDVLIEVGADSNPPQLDKALLGMGVGEVRSYEIEFPEGHQEAELAGRSVGFRVLLKGIKERRLPELDDELARELGPYEGVDALRADVRERLVAAKKDEAEREQDRQVVEQEAEARLRRGLEGLVRQGVDLDSIDVDWKSELEKARQGAEQGLRADYLLELVARSKGVEVGPEDVSAELDAMAQRRGTTRAALEAELRKANRTDAFKDSLRRRRTLDLLKSGATVSVE